jgi:hypothetical protein
MGLIISKSAIKKETGYVKNVSFSELKINKMIFLACKNENTA